LSDKASSFPPVLCLAGPTAAGKTGIAIKLARHHDFEIISVDSALVYRGLDIGSGKPDKNILSELPHHLVDIRDPSEPYSAAEFREDAIRIAQEVIEKGKRPLLVGGTMLYFKVLRDGLASMPGADPDIRQQILELGEKKGGRLYMKDWLKWILNQLPEFTPMTHNACNGPWKSMKAPASR